MQKTVVAVATITTRTGMLTRAAMLATCSALAFMIPVTAARAQNATWNTAPGSAVYGTGANWIPTTVPTGTAFFGSSSQTDIAINADVSVGGWTFNAGAGNYQFTTAVVPSVDIAFTGTGIVVNGGSVSLTNTSGNLNFQNNSSAGAATIINNWNLNFQNNSTAGSAAITNIGVLSFFNNSTAGNAAITNSPGWVTDFSTTSGPSGNHQLTAGSINGGGTFDLGRNQLTVGGNNLDTTVSGVIADGGAGGGTGGSLVKTGSGTMTLTGTNTYTGATTVNGGRLWVDGSITASNLTTVNSGATLTGQGTVGTTQINSGGILSPGTVAGASLTISGNLDFQSGAIYAVSVNPSAASYAIVTGAGGGIAQLNGATVRPFFAPGSYVSKQYTILTANGIFGTFASALDNRFMPANVQDSLSYDANNVYLNLTVSFSGPSNNGLNQNQRAVGDALVGYFNSTGGIPMVYASLSPDGLTQASGEHATGSQQATFDAMGQFMGLLTDPFMREVGCSGNSASAVVRDRCGANPAVAAGYAEEGAASAYAMFTKAPLRARPFEQRWSVWAAGFGGSQTTDGNTVVGSNRATSRIFGTAVGADYLFSPNTLAGFALAGGGTNFGVNGLGGGRSDLFQAGAYVHHTNGPAYVTAALAYGWQDVTTDRTVTIAGTDRLRAEFNANTWSGRLEGGYRFVAPWIGGVGLTPYAAGQVTSFQLPGYAEQVISGASAFALNYAAKDATDTRTELGLRTDKSFAQQNGVLTLRGRVAWAHDFDPNRAIAATFQALPGASFVVNGAAQAHDSALTTASAEMKWLNGWSAAATFEGEFSQVTRSYAGNGVLRYAW
ncbi:autotransporter outer membrane beta-barrel domain-containing protein [Bradyrhizobium sp. Cp5.3]|uniref:autotransporter family protein n=1 Tax=Bradyrhizobium sp. Cp5.3 TaxID=443598 RepID=UPI00041A3196|nr:autotransporter outer membrane beta-barrel domain-containing protein [Bradyrhizobium sp. Cp5.3]